ncbi:Uncharacterised protein [uncultured archaeon]|nr:Uncharacterised protein [uncultured archaeon]
MGKLSNLEDEVSRQLDEKLSRGNSDQPANGGDVLFFPRSLVQVYKQDLPYEYAHAMFIDRFLAKTATGLAKPSVESGIALASGLRSVIILTPQGVYQKLKGVNFKINSGNPHNNYLHQGYYGLCSPREAIKENIYFARLSRDHNFVAAHSGFVELHSHPNKDSSGLTESGKLAYEKDTKHDLKGIDKKILRLKDYSAVSGIEIVADTRLDEALYHLTRNGLTGRKAKTRDEILKYLCFSAGVSKACLFLSGYNWSEYIENTNCHVGNFVLTPSRSGLMDVGLVDLYALQSKRRYSSRQDFTDFSKKEVECFKWDFDEEVTASFPKPLKYRHFSKKLRGDCFNALRTGYYLSLFSWSGINSSMIDFPNTFIAPEVLRLGVDEFKHEVARLAK